MQPTYGDRLRGVHASPQNPQRDGFYVRTIRRVSKTNAGTWYVLTDCRGGFWEYRAEDVIFLERSRP